MNCSIISMYISGYFITLYGTGRNMNETKIQDKKFKARHFAY